MVIKSFIVPPSTSHYSFLDQSFKTGETRASISSQVSVANNSVL